MPVRDTECDEIAIAGDDLPRRIDDLQRWPVPAIPLRLDHVELHGIEAVDAVDPDAVAAEPQDPIESRPLREGPGIGGKRAIEGAGGEDRQENRSDGNRRSGTMTAHARRVRPMTEPADPQAPQPAPPQPAWRPPHSRDGNAASIVVGLLFVVIGGWYFLDQTLGLDMPRVRWADLWPIALIVIGLAVLFRSAGRRA
jgi:Domain of unknown function (DUF5668)